MPHALALDVLPLDADALLAADPAFADVCDARHEGYLAHALVAQVDPDDAPLADDEEQPRDGDLVDCRDCFGTGEGFSGRRCFTCAGRGYHVHHAPAADGSADL